MREFLFFRMNNSEEGSSPPLSALFHPIAGDTVTIRFTAAENDEALFQARVAGAIGDSITFHQRIRLEEFAVAPPECNDSLDNDGDGRFDFLDDPQCSSPADETEGGRRRCGLGYELAFLLLPLIWLRSRRNKGPE